jgi:hypothetical protein
VLEYGVSNKIMNLNLGGGEPVISSENVAMAIVILIAFVIMSAREIYIKTEQYDTYSTHRHKIRKFKEREFCIT